MFGGGNSGGSLFGNNSNSGGGGIFGGNTNNNNNSFGGGGLNSNVVQASRNRLNQMSHDYKKDLNVANPQHLPNDTVQCIRWCKNNSMKIFATGDWAGDLKIYQVEQNNNNYFLNLKKSQALGCPIFRIEWTNDSSTIFAGLSDGNVKAFQVGSGNVAQVANHPGLISMELAQINNKTIVITIGADKKVALWTPGNNSPIHGFQLKETPLVSGFSFPYLAIACSDFKIAVIALDKLGQGNQGQPRYFTSNLKSPLMSIAVQPNNRRVAVGSVDGRVCITDFDGNSFGSYGDNLTTKDYILFRAHRDEVKDQPQKSFLFQVNSLGFHQNHKDFLFTCGGNSIVYFWDCIKKDRTKVLRNGGIPVTAADVSPDAKCFAYALGYDWAYGVWGLPNIQSRPYICVHVVKNGEIKT